MKYELDWTRCHPENYHYTLIAILTGLPFDEIARISPQKACWGGQSFVRVFRGLGFNVNPKFKKFDPDTEYPCLMRCKRRDINEPYWYVFVYYARTVDMGNCRMSFESWQEQYPNLRVTSMLQVWI